VTLLSHAVIPGGVMLTTNSFRRLLAVIQIRPNLSVPAQIVLMSLNDGASA